MPPDSQLISTLNWVKHTEVTLNRPVKYVWPIFKDMSAWYKEYKFENVSGPPYEPGVGYVEGQVVRVKSAVGMPRAPNTSGRPAGPEEFLVKTVNVIHEKQIVVVLSGSAYDWRQLVQYYVWRMSESDGRTTVSVDAYGQAELFNPLSKQASIEYQDTLLKNWHRSWSAALQNLEVASNALAEGRDAGIAPS